MFEIGDKVRVVNFPNLNGETGAITKITIDEDETFFFVNVIIASHRLTVFPFMSDEIELVTPKKPDWEV